MLAIGVNHSKEDFNRTTIFVHHLTDDVTSEALPMCGADIESLMSGRPADGLLADIRRGRDPLFSDNSSRGRERPRHV